MEQLRAWFNGIPQDNNRDPVPVGVVIVDWVLFGVVVGVMTTLFFALMVTVFRGQIESILYALTDLPVSYSRSGRAQTMRLDIDVSQAMLFLQTGWIFLGIIMGVLTSITLVIVLFLYQLALHFVATKAFKGVGYISVLMHRTTWFFAKVYGITALVNLVMVGWVINLIGQNAGVYFGADMAAQRLHNQVSNVVSILAWGMLGIVVYYLLQYVAQVYQFDRSKGCFSVIFSYFLLNAVLFACMCGMIFSVFSLAVLA